MRSGGFRNGKQTGDGRMWRRGDGSRVVKRLPVSPSARLPVLIIRIPQSAAPHSPSSGDRHHRRDERAGVDEEVAQEVAEDEEQRGEQGLHCAQTVDRSDGEEHVDEVEQPLEDGHGGVGSARLEADEEIYRPEEYERQRRERDEVRREDEVLDEGAAREDEEQLEPERERDDEE